MLDGEEVLRIVNCYLSGKGKRSLQIQGGALTHIVAQSRDDCAGPFHQCA